jgi:hypothetical protein
VPLRRRTLERRNTQPVRLISNRLVAFAGGLFQLSAVLHTYTAAHLSGYPHHLRQMCANLLLNAVDATPSGGKIYARIAPAPCVAGRSQTRTASHICGYRQRHCRKKPGPHLGPVLYTKGPAGNGIGLSSVKTTVQTFGKPGRSSGGAERFNLWAPPGYGAADQAL